MTQIIAPPRSLASGAAARRNLDAPARSRRGRLTRGDTDAKIAPRRSDACAQIGRDPLGCYTDATGRHREVIARQRGDGCVLVVDRDAPTLGDRRLVALLAADEPTDNAALVCALYLQDARRGRCRRVTVEDLIGQALPEAGEESQRCNRETDLVGRHRVEEQDVTYRLELACTDAAGRELRWCRRSRGEVSAARPTPVCLREAIGALESYEPMCELTRRALARYREDANVSTTVLRSELERIRESPIVLNRKLRQTVLAATEHHDLSLSEIAIRCGRVKRDAKGTTSGETSWLARRVGILPESGSSRRTPWIHSDVLALIARNGLGISPREVELG
ncbi:MAG TPA: hypothetical protein VGH60_08490 [Solirubrobacteraceae bacterium]|jgi:hypothetical protein